MSEHRVEFRVSENPWAPSAAAHAAARRLHWSIERFQHRPDRIEQDLREAEEHI